MARRATLSRTDSTTLSVYNTAMQTRLLDLLVCPLCKGRLYPNSDHTELVCRVDRLAYPVRDGVPVMLEAQARTLSAQEPDFPA
ncbi:MAG: hypothetical protein RLY91_379 [Pseudomonadota bacterium]|jgi:uncharacterized protein YbaR (Trm112 family)